MNNQELKQLSEKILDYRAKHNLSAEKFADRCKLTIVTIYNIENGKQAPSKMTLRKILNVIESEV